MGWDMAQSYLNCPCCMLALMIRACRVVLFAKECLVLVFRQLQQSTGGITEFVPLPFVHMEAPIYQKGRSRRGPTLHEAMLLHAVARLVLYPEITNIQVSSYICEMSVRGILVC